MEGSYASLCQKCLRDCKQPAGSEIISCHFFKEQLVLNLKVKKKKTKKSEKMEKK